MTSLYEELTRKETACRICTYLATVPPHVADEWEHALAFSVSLVPNSNVVYALKRRGVALTEASVRRHRKYHVRVS